MSMTLQQAVPRLSSVEQALSPSLVATQSFLDGYRTVPRTSPLWVSWFQNLFCLKPKEIFHQTCRLLHLYFCLFFSSHTITLCQNFIERIEHMLSLCCTCLSFICSRVSLPQETLVFWVSLNLK